MPLPHPVPFPRFWLFIKRSKLKRVLKTVMQRMQRSGEHPCRQGGHSAWGRGGGGNAACVEWDAGPLLSAPSEAKGGRALLVTRGWRESEVPPGPEGQQPMAQAWRRRLCPPPTCVDAGSGPVDAGKRPVNGRTMP